ncbi:MAG: DUF1214 domain-containing protein [Myxococcales bacterium]|nr:DUF1214 domain-containing protein [Myxococcales bacterium]
MMRKVLVQSLDAVRRARLAYLKLRGETPASEAERKVLTGEAWSQYCKTLEAAGASLQFPGTPRGAFDQAEGYRYLARLVRAGLEGFLEDADPQAPVFKRVVHETIKMGADNPDNHYMNASVSGAYEYKIRGHRGTVKYLAFATQAGHYGRGGGMPPTGQIEASQLEINDDGTFEIIVSATKHEKNWLAMSPDTGLLIVRQTFGDKTKETLAKLSIERIDGPHAPRPLTPEQLVDGLENAGTLVAGASLLFAKWARDFQSHSNLLPRFDQDVSNKAGGDPNIAYYHSHWRLGPEEALVIEVKPPRCQYWNFQLNNYWMESLDYRYHRIHLNSDTATYEPDGSIRIVVTHRDPGMVNWLSTVGHSEGTMCFRWVRADDHPVPQTRVVPVSSLVSNSTRNGANP